MDRSKRRPRAPVAAPASRAAGFLSDLLSTEIVPAVVVVVSVFAIALAEGGPWQLSGALTSVVVGVADLAAFYVARWAWPETPAGDGPDVDGESLLLPRLALVLGYAAFVVLAALAGIVVVGLI